MQKTTPLYEKYQSLKETLGGTYRLSYFSPNNTISIANEKLQAIVCFFDERGEFLSANYKENLFDHGKGVPANEATLPADLTEIKDSLEGEDSYSYEPEMN